MVGALLLRGMLVGVLAGTLGFAFLRLAGEQAVERAIAFESQSHEATAHAGHYHGDGDGHAHAEAQSGQEAEPQLVSREVQAGLGLFTGVVVYSAAFGGLFALAFALAYGRIGALEPRAAAAMLAALGIIAVYIVPALKYPANPPAVGEAATIGVRTALYFAMIALSLAAMIGAGMLRNRLAPLAGGWNATLIAGAAYIAAMVVAAVLLPTVNEVPAAFPATVLWQFRVASLGAQLVLWTTLGLAFGEAAARVVARDDGLRSARALPLSRRGS